MLVQSIFRILVYFIRMLSPTQGQREGRKVVDQVELHLRVVRRTLKRIRNSISTLR